MRFNPPPNWPSPPPGWNPEQGWTPDPSWPPAPPGWQLWVDEDFDGSDASGRKRGAKFLTIGATALFLVIAVVVAGAWLFRDTPKSPPRDDSLARFTGMPGGVDAIAFSPDGTVLVAAGTDTPHGIVRFWDARQHTQLGEPISVTGTSPSVAFTPDGRLLAISSDGSDTPVVLLDMPNRTKAGELAAGGRGYEQSLSISSDSRILAIASPGQGVGLWDLQSRSRVGASIPNSTNPLVFSPVGTTLLVTAIDNDYTHTARLWDTATKNAVGIPLTGHTSNIVAVALSHDGKTAATSAVGGDVRLWDAATGRAIGEPIVKGETAFSIAFSPDDRLLATTGGDDGLIRVWNVQSRQKMGELSGHESFVRAIAFSPDGATLASGESRGDIRLWDMTKFR